MIYMIIDFHICIFKRIVNKFRKLIKSNDYDFLIKKYFETYILKSLYFYN